MSPVFSQQKHEKLNSSPAFHPACFQLGPRRGEKISEVEGKNSSDDSSQLREAKMCKTCQSFSCVGGRMEMGKLKNFTQRLNLKSNQSKAELKFRRNCKNQLLI